MIVNLIHSLPAVEAPLRDAVPPAQLSRLHPRFRLLQDGDDLHQRHALSVAGLVSAHSRAFSPGGQNVVELLKGHFLELGFEFFAHPI